MLSSAQSGLDVRILLPRLAHATPIDATLQQQISLASVFTDNFDADKLYLGVIRIASSLLQDEVHLAELLECSCF